MASPVRHLSLLSSLPSVTGMLERARRAQVDWAGQPVGRRLAIVQAFRHLMAERAEELARSVGTRERTSLAETLSAEVLPLAEACRFLEREAPDVLRSRRPRRGRPGWLRGVSLEIERRPWGLILVIGAGNYPLFLPGVQLVQSLTAGNAVVLKPAPGAEAPAQELAALLLTAGLDPDLVVVLESAPEAAQKILRIGVDKVLFTGSSTTGRKVLHQIADRLTPATLELSGCDAVFVLPGADLERVAKALRFGITFNSGATCIAPRRVFAARADMASLERRLQDQLAGCGPVRLSPEVAHRLDELVADALQRGARLVVGSARSAPLGSPVVLADVTPEMRVMQTDVFAPVLSLAAVDDMAEALRLDAACPYALGATVFGSPRQARRLATRIEAGVVVVNDLIVPTADPRAPFGGRAESGFGVTRGAEGLLELTQPRVVITRGGRWRPHFEPLAVGDERMFTGLLKAAHGRSLRPRLEGWIEVLQAARSRVGRSSRK